MTGEHDQPLAELGLIERQRSSVGDYLDLVAAWSPRVNLTGARTAAQRVAVLVQPVLAGQTWTIPGRLLDLGSGNGSPGLILALLCPALQVTLIEPRLKRWAFLREATRLLGRMDISVQRARYEEYSGPPVENISKRALTLSGSWVVTHLQTGGRLLAWGAPPTGETLGLQALSVTPGLWIQERVSRETPGDR